MMDDRTATTSREIWVSRSAHQVSDSISPASSFQAVLQKNPTSTRSNKNFKHNLELPRDTSNIRYYLLLCLLFTTVLIVSVGTYRQHISHLFSVPRTRTQSIYHPIQWLHLPTPRWRKSGFAASVEWAPTFSHTLSSVSNQAAATTSATVVTGTHFRSSTGCESMVLRNGRAQPSMAAHAVLNSEETHWTRWWLWNFPLWAVSKSFLRTFPLFRVGGVVYGHCNRCGLYGGGDDVDVIRHYRVSRGGSRSSAMSWERFGVHSPISLMVVCWFMYGGI